MSDRARYTPFLKMKANEVGAVSRLDAAVSDKITPFFDLARKSDMDDAAFMSSVAKCARKALRYFGENRLFYLDNFDIPDALKAGGKSNYEFVLNEFAAASVIPVLGLDRLPAHNAAVFDFAKAGKLKSNRVAVRLLEDDFEEFDLVASDLAHLMYDSGVEFDWWTLILDCRVCLTSDPGALAQRLSRFVQKTLAKGEFDEVLVAGSSIPASVADVAKVYERQELGRVELDVYRRVAAQFGEGEVGFGDYTIVSPLYSDADLPPEILLNVTAPKILYSYDDVHYVARGGAIKTHARGNLQYNDIAAEIVAKAFYRQPSYSWGDSFLAEKAQMLGSKVTPGSILQPTVNAHITYMAMDHDALA